jgi:hypothetical protein
MRLDPGGVVLGRSSRGGVSRLVGGLVDLPSRGNLLIAVAFNAVRSIVMLMALRGMVLFVAMWAAVLVVALVVPMRDVVLLMAMRYVVMDILSLRR